MKIIPFILELIGWFQIVLGCLIGSVLLGAAFCQLFTNSERMTVLIVTSSIGFISGACWASYIWKRFGTIEWLSRIKRIS